MRLPGFSKNDAGDQVARDNKKHINADEPPGIQPAWNPITARTAMARRPSISARYRNSCCIRVLTPDSDANVVKGCRTPKQGNHGCSQPRRAVIAVRHWAVQAGRHAGNAERQAAGMSPLNQTPSWSLNGASLLGSAARSGYFGWTIAPVVCYFAAVVREIPTILEAACTDTPSRCAALRNLLDVPTSITPHSSHSKCS